MRITEILTESQLEQLDEGPIGSAIGAVGRGIGKVAGGVAKGAGAVAGGVAGAGRAFKKGFQTGKAIVGDDPDPNAGQPGYTAPTAAGTPPTAQDINAAGPKGAAPAKAQTGQAAAALAKTDAVTDKQTATKAGETVYAQVKANIDKLDKTGKTRILNLLQKSIQQSPAKPAAKPSAGAGAFGQMAQQLAGGKPPNTMANTPVSATNTAKPGNPNAAPAAAPSGNYDPNTGAPISDKGKADVADMAAYKASPKGKEMAAWNDAVDAADAAGQKPPTLAQFRDSQTAQEPAGQGAFANVAQQLTKPTTRTQGGGKVAGELSQTPGAVKKRAARAAARQPAAVTASLVHHGKSLNEVLAQRLEMHKRKMFESAMSQGTASVFVK
jgi:hypothetical protein